MKQVKAQKLIGYTLALVVSGQEVKGSEFDVNPTTFMNNFKKRTAKPDGELEMDKAKYIVKKKNYKQ